MLDVVLILMYLMNNATKKTEIVKNKENEWKQIPGILAIPVHVYLFQYYIFEKQDWWHPIQWFLFLNFDGHFVQIK